MAPGYPGDAWRRNSLQCVVSALNGARGLRVGGQATEDELGLLLVLGKGLLGLWLRGPRQFVQGIGSKGDESGHQGCIEHVDTPAHRWRGRKPSLTVSSSTLAARGRPSLTLKMVVERTMLDIIIWGDVRCRHLLQPQCNHHPRHNSPADAYGTGTTTEPLRKQTYESRDRSWLPPNAFILSHF